MTHEGVIALLSCHSEKIKERRKIYGYIKGQEAIIIGDRDGIPGQAIAECAVSAGAEVVFSSTECFV